MAQYRQATHNCHHDHSVKNLHMHNESCLCSLSHTHRMQRMGIETTGDATYMWFSALSLESIQTPIVFLEPHSRILESGGAVRCLYEGGKCDICHGSIIHEDTHTHTHKNIHSYGWMMMKMSCQDMYLRACRVHISTFTTMSASRSGDTRARVSIYIYVCVILTHHDRNFSSIVCTSVVVTIPRRRK